MLTRTIALFAIGVAAVLFGAAPSDAQPGKGGKGPGKAPAAGSGSDIQKLERDLERLLEQIQATKAQLARAKQGGKDKGGDGQNQQGQFEDKSKKSAGGKKGEDGQKGQQGQGDGKAKKGFEGKKDLEVWWGSKGKKGFGGGWKGFEGKGGPGAKLDPETIKERYEYYKKLYDALPKEKGKGKGKGFEGKGKGKGFEGKKKEPTPEPKGKGGKGGPEGKGAKGGPGGGAGGSGRSVEARIDALIRELEALRNEVKGGKKK